MNPVVVISLGNPLMSDEGVGPRVLEALSARANDFPGVDFVDAGTSLLGAVHSMAGRRKAALVDCAVMGAEPGALRRFTPAEVASRKAGPGFSLHEGDLLSAIDLSRRLGECPPEIVLFGIQPASMEMGERLSPVLEAKLGEYVAAVCSELAKPAA